MKSLAADKLGLQLMDSFLPMGSLEQGLDVLQIMRNIHIFVSKWSELYLFWGKYVVSL